MIKNIVSQKNPLEQENLKRTVEEYIEDLVTHLMTKQTIYNQNQNPNRIENSIKIKNLQYLLTINEHNKLKMKMELVRFVNKHHACGVYCNHLNKFYEKMTRLITLQDKKYVNKKSLIMKNYYINENIVFKY